MGGSPYDILQKSIDFRQTNPNRYLVSHKNEAFQLDVKKLTV